ncbi:MAG: Asp-tRNA(Asn)/Glu-tRNA(Gln) amidotransferase subunit GatB [Actinobacteria bacterium]|nr:Asp-tRNA(Asn)/Glu-tRNA(Gln) amidotransferase subunit GatB [Actinomycetota bacterium]MCL6088523.1 Asp-tRNA(Asn)/Glu-tRNA(Gln) amidotransferase subunit GatB [Actinomycetota bacterium]
MENKSQDLKNEYETVIGLETHVELSTLTKMFCGCRLSFGEPPNTYTCPVCLGHPGSLPVINKKAIENAVKIALALNCTIKEHTVFHRKNYFYPDMPKNYQISQYDLPVGIDGYVDVNIGSYIRRIGITRVHVEEDTGKLLHIGSTGRISEANYSIVDFNRAGTPLIEIVTMPDIKSPEEARQYMITLRNILIMLNVSDCSMEEGSIRSDANVSIKLVTDSKLGTRTEIKNLNSFKFLQKGLDYEVQRQIDIIKSGRKVVQQTRHYDSKSQTTKALREKEEAHDYRYFPDPDLVPMKLDTDWINEIKSTLPELPSAKEKRYKELYRLSDYDSSLMANDLEFSSYFEETLKYYNDAKTVCNWIMGDFSAYINKEGITLKQSKISPENLASLLKMIDSGEISSKIAKSVFEEMYTNGSSPGEIISKKGLKQISDAGELEKVIDEVISSNPDVIKQYKSGKSKAIGFLIGQIMRKTQGKANPGLVNEIILKKLS